jgi:hypothetical protein
VYPADTVSDGLELTTVLGEVITFTVSEDNVTKVNGAELVATDILANNGVIHKIDKVLVPEKAIDILNGVDDQTGAPTVTPPDSGSFKKAGIATTAFMSLIAAVAAFLD